MNITMFLLVAVYSAAVFLVTRKIYQNLIFKAHREVAAAKLKYQKITEEKGNLFYEKRMLQEKSDQVFTLYDMTKEFSKNFDAKDAFNVFEKKLSGFVKYKDCRWLDADSAELKDYQENDEYFIIPLKGKKESLGYLAVNGSSLDDKDIIMTLAHQFALGLRRIKLYKELETLAITDSLTGAYTRRYIFERFEEELERSRLKGINASFLMIDVDHFKLFNDEFGHLTGDRILQGISEVISESVREMDIVGRYGGEEFCVILPEADRSGAGFVAERIRLSVEKTPIEVYHKKVKTTVSIGAVTFPQDAHKMSELIDKADWALYRAKKLGRNTICAFGVHE